jgi:D-serine dehydratase
MNDLIANGLLDDSFVDQRTKGMPGGIAPFALAEIGRKGWNLLREDLPLPLAVLKRSALDHNSGWMRRFLLQHGAVIAPHGKTTMSPKLFQQQLDDGAWAITLATVGQLQVARAQGFDRIVLANQLVGKQAILTVLAELARDPAFEFLCLADSVAGVEAIAALARENPPGRPVGLLLEGGVAGGRTGCRDLASALPVARAIKAAEPLVTLRGVEGFEGLISGATPEERDGRVTAFIDFLGDIARAVAAEGLFAEGPVILSAGGSAYYDIVVKRFGRVALDREIKIVTRSGCYLTHDSLMYQGYFEELSARAPEVAELGEGLRPAIEVWAYVQSMPEPGLAVATMGRRDCSYDRELPLPVAWFRPGEAGGPRPLAPGYKVTRLHDQHAEVTVPADSPLRVGDMLVFGISHPCTTFDKWRVIPIVNDDYDVVDAIRTYF